MITLRSPLTLRKCLQIASLANSLQLLDLQEKSIIFSANPFSRSPRCIFFFALIHQPRPIRAQLVNRLKGDPFSWGLASLSLTTQYSLYLYPSLLLAVSLSKPAPHLHVDKMSLLKRKKNPPDMFWTNTLYFFFQMYREISFSWKKCTISIHQE